MKATLKTQFQVSARQTIVRLTIAAVTLWLTTAGVDQRASAAPHPNLALNAAVSRHIHAGTGPFDLDLPLTGNPAVEPRGTGTGTHTIIFKFNATIISAAASVTSGTGTVSGTTWSGGNVTVDLSAVANAQVITVSVTATDSSSTTITRSVRMGVLFADVTANGLVNSNDVLTIASVQGQLADATNFVADLNLDGTINSADAVLARNRSGSGLPGVTISPGSTEALSFIGPTTIYVSGQTSFNLSVNLTYSGYSALGLSYWLAADSALGPHLSVSSGAVSYFTFGTAIQTTPVVFNSSIGATSGFMTADRDFGGTTSPTAPVPPPSGGSAYHITDIRFTVDSTVPTGTHTLRSVLSRPRFSQVTDSSFVEHYLTPAANATASPLFPEASTLTFDVLSGAPTVVSRKTHGKVGIFDISLPLSGAAGIECRAGTGAKFDQHQIVATFPTSVAVGGVTVTSQDGGSAAATITTVGAVVTINLTSVADQHSYTITLSNVDYGSSIASSVAIPVSFLRSDVSGDRVVNSGDVLITRNRSGQNLDGTTFRSDINLDGVLNSADVQIVRNASGNSLP